MSRYWEDTVYEQPSEDKIRKNAADTVQKEKKKGKIILLASHNSEDIEYLCDTIYKLENGRMIS